MPKGTLAPVLGFHVLFVIWHKIGTWPSLHAIDSFVLQPPAVVIAEAVVDVGLVVVVGTAVVDATVGVVHDLVL